MDVINKLKALSRSTADATADIGLINQYSKKELAPDEVYAYSLILCDNDEDRDGERFTNKTLDALAPMFLGKTGIFDHWRSAEKQHSRIYRTSVEKAGEMNSLGEPLSTLRADAYMLRTDDTKPIIDAIEGGILKEVSVSCRVKECNCSICKNRLNFIGPRGRINVRLATSKGSPTMVKNVLVNLKSHRMLSSFPLLPSPRSTLPGLSRA